MFQELIALLSRFVVAVETIAANASSGDRQAPAISTAKQPSEEVAAAAEDKPKRGRKPAAGKEVAPEDEPEEKTKSRRGRKTADVDFAALREQIADIDDAINDGESNEAVDEFDDLMDEYEAKKLKDLKDEDLVEFLAAAQKIVNKYYESE